MHPSDIVWYPTSYRGIWFSCFEADDRIQEHPLTMLTRFDPGGFFPAQGHPDGEEILVLEGSFSDETGDYPTGSYLLNPEGVTHVPYSEKGCITFVKLRQHGGTHRKQIKTNIYDLDWRSSSVHPIEIKLLYQQDGFPEQVWLERWQPGTVLSKVRVSQVKEIFVLRGVWSDETGEYPAGTWLRYPPGCSYKPVSEIGCTLYVKTYPLKKGRLRCDRAA